MILAAVLLVVGLIALAGMVGRVNQLGSQTATEADKAILDEVVPLASALQDGIAEMRGARDVAITSKVVATSIINVDSATPLVEQDEGRHISSTTSNCVPNGATITAVLSTTQATISASPANTAACTARLGAVVTGVVMAGSLTTLRSCTSVLCATTVAAFSADDVGLAVTGTGIPPGTVITAYTNSNSVTISASATAGAREVSIGPFALTTTSTPTMKDGVIGLLEQFQAIEAGHGLLLDYELRCLNAADTTTYAYAHLSDGTVWVEIPTNVPITVAAGTCTQSASCTVPTSGTIFACG